MHDHSPGKIDQGHACCVVCVSAVWPGAMVLCCGVYAALSNVEMGSWVCGAGGGSSRARAKRGSLLLLLCCSVDVSYDLMTGHHTRYDNVTRRKDNEIKRRSIFRIPLSVVP